MFLSVGSNYVRNQFVLAITSYSGGYAYDDYLRPPPLWLDEGDVFRTVTVCRSITGCSHWLVPGKSPAERLDLSLVPMSGISLAFPGQLVMILGVEAERAPNSIGACGIDD